MNQEREKLIEKIRKLLALADSDRNESEAQVKAALVKAEELSRKYDIDLVRCGNFNEREEVEDLKIWEGWSLPSPKRLLAKASALLFNCDVLIDKTARPYQLLIVGTRKDAAIVMRTYTWLLNKSVHLAAKAKKENRSLNVYPWRMGFAQRINDRVGYEIAQRRREEMNGGDNQIWGLVKASKKTRIDEWMRSKGVKTKMVKTHTRDPRSYCMGKQAGDTLDYHQPNRNRFGTAAGLLTS